MAKPYHIIAKETVENLAMLVRVGAGEPVPARMST